MGKEEADVEVIRKFIDANSLMSIMALPEAFRNRKLEIIVLPTEEETTTPQKPDVAGTVGRSLPTAHQSSRWHMTSFPVFHAIVLPRSFAFLNTASKLSDPYVPAPHN